MKAIMVPVADRPECAKALVAAFDLAEQFSSNVVGYHLRPHNKEKRSAAQKQSWSTDSQSQWQSKISQRQVALDSKNAARLFSELADLYKYKLTSKPKLSDKGRLALWHTVTGDPEHLFSIIGPLSDLIIVTRPKSKRSVKAQSFASAALMCSGRPVLFLPNRKLPTLGQHILLAWNQSEQAASAVMSSMSLLTNAETVTIVTALNKNHLGPSIKHLQQYLALYGIKTKVIKTPGHSPEDEIVQAYVDANADLLMMGAYSRSKWRERIFGGATQHILTNTQLPTLMMHKQS